MLSLNVFSPGPFQTNCYVVAPPGAAGNAGAKPPCWIIDAGFDPGVMIGFAKQNYTPELLILTHCHIDHIAGAHAVKRAFPGIKVCVHEGEAEWLTDAELNLSTILGQPTTGPVPDRLLREGDTLELGVMRWNVLHTPGHSPGSVSLYCVDEAIAFVGDALFAGSIGRTDFPGCSFEELEKSIRTKLYTLPDGTVFHPGHGPKSTIGREKRSNPFVRP
jgi:hydroxyacylglutathione hydrolase